MSQIRVAARELKRTRRACLNCRRKKTRCSGERPVCSYCVHLKQDCQYSDSPNLGSSTVTASTRIHDGAPGSTRISKQDTGLAARVAFLEARLGVTDQEILRTSDQTEEVGTLDVQSNRSRNSDNHSCSASPPLDNDTTNKFSIVPNHDVLRSAADVYFSSCQNQPYCYFHEESFRRRLEEGDLPTYLLLTFMATSARYSSDDFFEGRQFEAIEIYARSAWREILKSAFSSDLDMHPYTVVATNMLAVVDFTDGRHRLGWVKIGLSVRFAQGLRLNAEPDPNLPVWQREEHRRIFWSVYLLDKLVSCCRNRPPTILDVDCLVRLPSSEENFRAQVSEETPTLAVLETLTDSVACGKLDHFALTILVASMLGRVVRYSLQQDSSLGFPPWDARSDYAKITSVLLSFEHLLVTSDGAYSSFIRLDLTTTAGIDRQRAGHFIWSRGLYQLCRCLLNHPLLMQRCLQRYRDIYPHSFLREALRHCRDCAEQITMILSTVDETTCCAYGSFLGYFAVVAGTVHQIYLYSTNEFERAMAGPLSLACLNFLEHQPVRWRNYPRMATALREFTVDLRLAHALIEPFSVIDDHEMAEAENLWCILDYGWLSDASRCEGPIRPSPPAMSGWGLFENLVGEDLFFTGGHGSQTGPGIY